MNLANPTALLWLGLALPVVIFYILKIRLRRVPVSTLLFWQQIFQEKQARSLWHRLRHLVSLVIQLAFLLFLVAALAEPVFDWELRQASQVVLVLDNSASMNATDVGPTRLTRAREQARQIVDGLRFRDQMAVVAAGTQPQVVCGLTGHQGTLRQAIDSILPTDGPTRVPEAVALARRLLADQPNRKVIVLTDGCFDGAKELAAARDVQVAAFGNRTGNVGITRFQVRRSHSVDPLAYEILAGVVNASDEPVGCRFELELDGRPLDVVPLRLDPGGRWSEVFEKTSPEGGRLVARIDRPDALAADNVAQALLPPRKVQKVLLVSAPNTGPHLFLEKVFEANLLVNLTATAVPPTRVPEGTVTVFHRQVPDRLPSGPILVIDPATSCGLWQVGETVRNPLVAKQDKDSPLMANVRLDNLLLPEARRLIPRGAAHVLAATVAGDPLYCRFDRPEGPVLVLAVNLENSDLPLRNVFPILASNALAWFAGTQTDLREALATGSVTEVELPADAGAEVWLRAPDGRVRQLPVQGRRTTIGPLDQCGIWSMTATSASDANTPSLREIACNLTSARESDLRPPEGFNSTMEPVTAGWANQPVWFYLIVVAWLLIGLEWYLYQRRWTD
jgi:hypothetical protein